MISGHGSAGRPVLVTGAGGFVGGHVARAFARAGYPVRGLSRKAPRVEPGDPPIDWVLGDLRSDEDRRRALAGVGGVVHVAGWVSLRRDRNDQSRGINVEVTRALLDACAPNGIGRFVYTSTLWTTAAGTPGRPAVEADAWNLAPIRSPYSETKREAERLVLGRNGESLRTLVICPGLVVGPRDARPTSTGLLLTMARWPLSILPGGGIPLVDATVLARAHLSAYESGEPGTRYIVAGAYQSYPEIARLVAALTGRPSVILNLPGAAERPMRAGVRCLERVAGRRLGEISEAAVAGGFLRLHASGARADAAFGLRHPPPITSIYEALEDHRRTGRAPWLPPLVRPPTDL